MINHDKLYTAKQLYDSRQKATAYCGCRCCCSSALPQETKQAKGAQKGTAPAQQLSLASKFNGPCTCLFRFCICLLALCRKDLQPLWESRPLHQGLPIAAEEWQRQWRRRRQRRPAARNATTRTCPHALLASGQKRKGDWSQNGQNGGKKGKGHGGGARTQNTDSIQGLQAMLAAQAANAGA